MLPSFGNDKSNKDDERYFELLNKQNQILEDNGRNITELLTTLVQKIDKKDHIKMAIAAFFGVAANMLMFFKGLELTTPINSAVLMLFTPAFWRK